MSKAFLTAKTGQRLIEMDEKNGEITLALKWREGFSFLAKNNKSGSKETELEKEATSEHLPAVVRKKRKVHLDIMM